MLKAVRSLRKLDITLHPSLSLSQPPSPSMRRHPPVSRTTALRPSMARGSRRASNSHCHALGTRLPITPSPVMGLLSHCGRGPENLPAGCCGG